MKVIGLEPMTVILKTTTLPFKLYLLEGNRNTNRKMGIEPTPLAWKAIILPLNTFAYNNLLNRFGTLH